MKLKITILSIATFFSIAAMAGNEDRIGSAGSTQLLINPWARSSAWASSGGAHIKGLGRPHNGPDIIENMLCLCPNHHDQFDKYSFYIDYKTLKIKELEGYKNLKLNLNQKHKLDREFLKYHHENYLKNNPTQNRN